MLTVSLAPSARLGHVQVTVCTPTLHVPPTDTLIAGAGPVKRLEVATSAIFWLSLGPLFVTVSVNVATPLPGDPDVTALCVNARSADVRTVPHAWDELLVPTGSAVVAEMVAVLQS